MYLHRLYKCGFLQTYFVMWWLISIKIIIHVGIICHPILPAHFKDIAVSDSKRVWWKTQKADEGRVHIWTLTIKLMRAFFVIYGRGWCVRKADDVCIHMWIPPNWSIHNRTTTTSYAKLLDVSVNAKEMQLTDIPKFFGKQQ